jgi:hypothetical protein
MTKVKNASGRAGGKVTSAVEKAAEPVKPDMTALISRSDAIAKKVRERRPRTRDIGELARKYAARAIERIAEIMESDNNREALAAAFHLLDRAYGKSAGIAEEKNDTNEVMLGLRESLRAKLARLTE